MIVLQFVRGNDFGANAISWFGHGANFSHVDTVVAEGLLGARSDRVGGAPPGVQVRDPAYINGYRAALRVQLPCEPLVTAKYLDFVHSQIGMPYDHEGILAFVVGRDWRGPGSWFCSELVAAGLEEAGYFEHPLASPSNKIDPASLILALSVGAPIDLKAATVPPAAVSSIVLPHAKDPS